MSGLLGDFTNWVDAKKRALRQNVGLMFTDPQVLYARLSEDMKRPDVEAYIGQHTSVLPESREYYKKIAQAEDQRVLENAMEFLTFGGVGAKTANLVSLDKAKKMKEQGETALQIWRETGWTNEFPDKKWRFEIDDSMAVLNPDASKHIEAGKKYAGKSEITAADIPKIHAIKDSWDLPDLLQHDELYDAYPQLRNLKARVDAGLDARGSYSGSGSSGIGEISFNPKAIGDDEDIPQTLLHEIQHAIQRQEGFAKGGNTIQAPTLRETKDLIDALESDLFKAQKRGDKEGYKKLYEALWNLQTGEGAYKRLAGEAEARLTASRAQLDKYWRGALEPWTQFDVPRREQIVSFGDAVQQSKRGLLNPEIPNPTNDPYVAKIAARFEEARKNAALPKSKGGLGLPADNTAAQRAKAMGFDTDAYHGTLGDIREFDPTWHGMATNAPSARKADFFSESPKVATGYAYMGQSREIRDAYRNAQIKKAGWAAQPNTKIDADEFTKTWEPWKTARTTLEEAQSKASDDLYNAQKRFQEVLKKHNAEWLWQSPGQEGWRYNADPAENLSLALKARKYTYEEALQRLPTQYAKENMGEKMRQLAGGDLTWDTLDDARAIANKIGEKDKRLGEIYRHLWLEDSPVSPGYTLTPKQLAEYRKKFPELVPSAKDVKELADAYESVAKAEKEAAIVLDLPSGANVMPAKLNTQKFADKDFGGSRYRDETYNELIKSAASAQAPGVSLRNTYDPGNKAFDEMTTVFAVRDPSRIRSRFAAFDPAKKKSPDILAGLLAGGIGIPTLAGLLGYGQEEQY